MVLIFCEETNMLEISFAFDVIKWMSSDIAMHQNADSALDRD